MASTTEQPGLIDRLAEAARSQVQGASAMYGMLLDHLSENHAKAAASWTVNPEGGVARTADGVVVTSKELVMQVFLNTDGNYSVNGYDQRAQKSIGPIYLGLDWGPDYEAQSTKANAAIGTVTRREAFDYALQATRDALAALPDPAAFDIQQISDQVLAAVCKHWFDVPDGKFVEAGGFALSNVLPPAKCPADYTYPSAYIFHPDPDFVLTLLGERTGQMLREAVGQLVASYRTAGKLPDGALSRAFFEAFPNPADNDLLARVIIGAMMGMLPTVNGNLTATVKAWQKTETFMVLQGKLNGNSQTDEFLRAQDVIEPAMVQSMQKAPTPDAVWRTAVKAHVLGVKDPVQVNPGDKVYISIQQATQQDLRKGVADVCPVFGGNRKATPHPLHACPGLEMAMGVLLGTIYGVVDQASKSGR